MDRLPITGCTREENCDSPLQTDCLRQTVPGKIPVTERNVTDHNRQTAYSRQCQAKKPVTDHNGQTVYYRQ